MPPTTKTTHHFLAFEPNQHFMLDFRLMAPPLDHNADLSSTMDDLQQEGEAEEKANQSATTATSPGGNNSPDDNDYHFDQMVNEVLTDSQDVRRMVAHSSSHNTALTGNESNASLLHPLLSQQGPSHQSPTAQPDQDLEPSPLRFPGHLPQNFYQQHQQTSEQSLPNADAAKRVAGVEAVSSPIIDNVVNASIQQGLQSQAQMNSEVPLNWHTAVSQIHLGTRGLAAPAATAASSGVQQRGTARKKEPPPKRPPKKASSSSSKHKKPKRNLSAYNLFFQAKRKELLEMLPDRESRGGKTPRNSHGKLGFKEMANLVGRNWKALTPQEKKPFEELAAKDLERYQREMSLYKQHCADETAAVVAAARNARATNSGTSARGPPSTNIAAANNPSPDLFLGNFAAGNPNPTVNNEVAMQNLLRLQQQQHQQQLLLLQQQQPQQPSIGMGHAMAGGGIPMAVWQQIMASSAGGATAATSGTAQSISPTGTGAPQLAPHPQGVQFTTTDTNENQTQQQQQQHDSKPPPRPPHY